VQGSVRQIPAGSLLEILGRLPTYLTYLPKIKNLEKHKVFDFR
jgi:hypothetical protein